MKRVVVLFDILDEDKGVYVKTVKLFNDPSSASNYVQEYINQRKNLVWTFHDGEFLSSFNPGAEIEFYGYLKDEKCSDMITIYHAEEQDPDENPFKKLLRYTIDDFIKNALADEGVTNSHESTKIDRMALNELMNSYNKLND